MSKVRKGDTVSVICGRDKGKSGVVLKIHASKKATKVLVEGIAMVSKHVKPNPQKNEQGGIVKKEAMIDVSNVAVINPRTKKADRIGVKTLEDGAKVRYFKSDKEVVDV